MNHTNLVVCLYLCCDYIIKPLCDNNMTDKIKNREYF